MKYHGELNAHLKVEKFKVNVNDCVMALSELTSNHPYELTYIQLSEGFNNSTMAFKEVGLEKRISLEFQLSTDRKSLDVEHILITVWGEEVSKDDLVIMKNLLTKNFFSVTIQED